MSFSNAWSAVGGIGAAVAAIAALVALVYARKTVSVARDGLDVVTRALADVAEAEQAAVTARGETLTEESNLLRLRSLERISESVGRIGVHLGETAPKGAIAMHVRTQQHQLRTALAILTVVGGPELPRCRQLATAPQHLVGFLLEDAFDELVETSARILE